MKRILFMQSQNFEFLRKYNANLASLAGLAEAVMHIDPGSALTRLRAFTEELTKSIYKEERLPRVPQANFYEMVKSNVFTDCVGASLVHQINTIRMQGNGTAHGGKGDLRNAQMSMGTAHQLGMYLAIKYYGIKKADIPAYIDVKSPLEELKAAKKSIQKFKEENVEKTKIIDELLEREDIARIKTFEKEPSPSPEIKEYKKQQSQKAANSLQWNEAETRKQMIDTMLDRAGWNVKDPDQVGIEVPVDFPSNPSGIGKVDYVLWGDNGQPLAVVEAKRASNTSLQAGREQARLYADAFERMGKQRPIVFYTNGYETHIWDDAQYNTYRHIYGLYSKDSLDYLIYQRQFRVKNLEQHNPNLNIAGRPYQIESIKTVANHFQEQRRKALIVQATGTGKTRVAIALAELLLRTGWGKRVLFLCDRKELRKQADDAFKEHLPSEPRCVIGETNSINSNARIYIATYPGMMNRMAQLDVGFFDIVIADESHRSIYNKYRDIFDYFDALNLGLTATPVQFISRNTFDLFGCETTDPTFEYSFEQAIQNEPPYLSHYTVKDLTTEFLRDGIHYNDLDDDQKRQLEDDLGVEEAQHTTIAGKYIGKKIFSESTDAAILENLINNGIKDETNTLIGKTIIFAQRKDHAEHLEKVFNTLYPQLGAKVCKVIHNSIPKVDVLLEEFKKPSNDFRIAISVDMMDTGIDVPEVVNLVFAKTVRSIVKFKQMIGRGTRLSEDLFGPGKHKQEFKIFDHYSNFVYFDEEYQESEENDSLSLHESNFQARLELVRAALKNNHAQAFDTAVTLLQQDINDLPEQSIAVKRELRSVHTLLQTDMLQKMDAATQHLLERTIGPLMGARTLQDKFAVAFDRLVAKIQTCLVKNASCFDDGKDELLAEIDRLAVNIGAVRQKDAIIAEVRSAEFWQAASIEKLETARKALRGIMKYRVSPGGTSEQKITKQKTEVFVKQNEKCSFPARAKCCFIAVV